jgi:hypothetical protein
VFVFVIELDVPHLEAAAPLGLVPQTILERTARVLLSDEELYRFRVVKLRERYRLIARDRIRLLDAALPHVEASPTGGFRASSTPGAQSGPVVSGPGQRSG